LLLLVACKSEPAGDSSAKGKDAKDGKGSARKASLIATVVQASSIQSKVRGVGTLLAGEQVEIKSEVGGRIQSINFREGQYVEKGALLLKLNDAELVAQKSKLQNHLTLLQSTLTRRKQQLDLQAISQQDYEQSTSDVISAQADLDLVTASLAKTEVRAPFAGVLGLRRVGDGAVISSGQSITTLVQVSPLKAELSIPGEQAVFARPGQSLLIRTVNGEEHKAKVYATEGAIDEASRSLTVRATVEGKGGGLIPGSAIEYEIDIPQLSGILVSPEAIAGDAKGSIVYLYKEGKAAPVAVKLGQRTVDQVQILQGVSVGDTVLHVGASQVRPGMPVELSEIR